jgi:hypothetical protein
MGAGTPVVYAPAPALASEEEANLILGKGLRAYWAWPIQIPMLMTSMKTQATSSPSR